MRQALLCVSFGTAVESARESIAAVENALQQAAPGLVFMRAFTSPTVRKLLADGGETVLSPTQALYQLKSWGFQKIIVQPTHVLKGREYDGLAAELIPWLDKFQVLELGSPLLSDTDDLRQLARVLDRACPRQEKEALVLFGHGSRCFSNAAYPALQTAFRLMGREDVLVGTVENWPGYEEIAGQLEHMEVERVHLFPLMLTAGRAARLVTEPEDSWKSRLEAAGYTVTCTNRGLGLLDGVQAMYCKHFSENPGIAGR